MLEAEVYQKVRLFVYEALLLAEPSFNINKNKIIIANQSDSRPVKPFVTIQLSSFRDVGSPIRKAMLSVDNQDIQESLMSRLCTASVQVYSDKLQQAEDIANHIYRYLYTEMVNNIFGGELALRRVLKTVTAIPTALNEQIESRAFFDIELGYITSVKYSVGWIKTVEVTNQINDQIYIIERE